MAKTDSKKRGLPLRVKMRHDTHFVEELTSRHETPVGKMVPLSAIEPDPEQPRKSMGDLDDLVASIESKGVLEPILVRPLGEDDGSEFRIISGERRYRAAQEAGLISRTWFHTGDTSSGNLGQQFGDVFRRECGVIPPCPPVVVLVGDAGQAQHHPHPPQRAPEPEHSQVRRVTLNLGT